MCIVGGAKAGYFCLLSCGVGCRVVLSGHGCGLFGVRGVGRGVRRVRAEKAAAGRGQPREAEGFVPSPRGMCHEWVDPVTSYLIPVRLEGLV